MRIVSLVPSATETLFALGLGDEVTAVTHECDHPPEALDLPRVTRDVIGPGLPPDEIDRAVRELDRAGPRDLRARRGPRCARSRPTSSSPRRCARSARSPTTTCGRSPSGWTRAPEVLALDPHTLGEVLGDIRTLARATDARTPASRWSRTPRAGSTASGWPCAARRRCGVAALEWLDPVFVAGHWTPQLIEYAGGDRRARPAGRAVRDAQLGGGRGRAARGRGRDAVRLRRGARARGGRGLRRRAGRARRAAGRRGRRRRRTSPAPARGSWTGSS